VVRSQPRQIVHETLSRKTLHKNRAGGVASDEGPEFKPQYHKKKIVYMDLGYNFSPLAEVYIIIITIILWYWSLNSGPHSC
jgi:hypothetical protein